MTRLGWSPPAVDGRDLALRPQYDMSGLRCVCGKPLPKANMKGQLYCSKKCRLKAQRNRRAR